MAEITYFWSEIQTHPHISIMKSYVSATVEVGVSCVKFKSAFSVLKHKYYLQLIPCWLLKDIMKMNWSRISGSPVSLGCM